MNIDILFSMQKLHKFAFHSGVTQLVCYFFAPFPTTMGVICQDHTFAAKDFAKTLFEICDCRQNGLTCSFWSKKES